MSSQTMVPAITSIPCGSTSSSSSCTSNAARTMLKALVLAVMTLQVSAWGSSSGDDGSVYDASIYGNALDRDWLYSGTGISMKFEGCIWGTVEDNEDSGCMEDSSEDGTTYWYQMANCRRAQAVYSIYAASSSHASCNGGNFKETVRVGEGQVSGWVDGLFCFSVFSHSLFFSSLKTVCYQRWTSRIHLLPCYLRQQQSLFQQRR